MYACLITGLFSVFVNLLQFVDSRENNYSVITTVVVKVKVGDTAHLSCGSTLDQQWTYTSQRSPETEVVWSDNMASEKFRGRFSVDTVDGHGSTSSPSAGDTRLLLVIRDVRLLDAGLYTCLDETEDDRETTSHRTKLVVTEPSDEVEITTSVGQTITLPCRSNYRNAVNWYFRNRTDHRVQIADCGLLVVIAKGHAPEWKYAVDTKKNSLMICDVQPSDAGVYVCIDDCGVARSRFVALVVKGDTDNSSVLPINMSTTCNWSQVEPSPNVAPHPEESTDEEHAEASFLGLSSAATLALFITAFVATVVVVTVTVVSCQSCSSSCKSSAGYHQAAPSATHTGLQPSTSGEYRLAAR